MATSPHQPDVANETWGAPSIHDLTQRCLFARQYQSKNHNQRTWDNEMHLPSSTAIYIHLFTAIYTHLWNYLIIYLGSEYPMVLNFTPGWFCESHFTKDEQQATCDDHQAQLAPKSKAKMNYRHGREPWCPGFSHQKIHNWKILSMLTLNHWINRTMQRKQAIFQIQRISIPSIKRFHRPESAAAPSENSKRRCGSR